MSQAGPLDAESSNPQIPTSFITDDGVAVPINNQLELLASVVPNAGIPFQSTGSGNVVTYEIQYADETAVTDATKVGVASFDSSAFAVDANGFVTLIGGGVAATNIDVDASTPPGTDPVVPDGAGNIVMTGGQVAAGTVGANVIRTNSTAANSLAIEIQRTTSAAGTNSIHNGVAHFNSTDFSVDANGFVSLSGSGNAIDSIGVQTGTNPIVPTAAGLVTINGAVVAAGTNPVRSDGTGANTMAIEVQISQALAATDATKIGLSNFDSAAFDVDANGFVQLNGGGVAATSFEVQSNTGPGTDPVVPSATGVVTINGAAVANHSVVLESHSRAANAYNLEIQYATSAAATDATKSGVAHFDSTDFAVDANGFVTLAGAGAGQTITGDSGGALAPTAGNWDILGQQAGTVAVMDTVGTAPSTLRVEDRTWTTAYVVDSSATVGLRGTFSTIQAAITAASSGTTIFIRPGTYTEDLTLKSGVNLIGYASSSTTTPPVIILGKATLTTGTVAIDNICLKTNGDYICDVSGVASLNLYRCNFIISSHAFLCNSGIINFFQCNLSDTGAASGAWFTCTNASTILVQGCYFIGTTTTVSTFANTSGITIRNSAFHSFISTSNTARVLSYNSNLVAPSGQTFLTTTGTAATNEIYNSLVAGGSASVISVGAGTTLTLCNSVIDSDNTDAITVAGTLLYAGLSFKGTSSNVGGAGTKTPNAEGSSRTIGSANTGATNTLLLTNSSNTASSNALQNISVGGTSAGDAFQTFTVSGTTNWSQGVDNSVTGDPFVIAASTALGTTNIMSATTAGEINYPLQPAFFAYQDANQTNTTGNGTYYTLGTTKDLTEVFDQNSDFDPTSGTFTAPVTGRYSFNGIADMNALTAAMTTGEINIVTSNRTWISNYVNIGAGRTVAALADHYGLQASIFTDMDAADTATCRVKIEGGAGNTSGVGGGSNVSTAFSGYLEC